MFVSIQHRISNCHPSLYAQIGGLIITETWHRQHNMYIGGRGEGHSYTLFAILLFTRFWTLKVYAKHLTVSVLSSLGSWNSVSQSGKGASPQESSPRILANHSSCFPAVICKVRISVDAVWGEAISIYWYIQRPPHLTSKLPSGWCASCWPIPQALLQDSKSSVGGS